MGNGDSRFESKITLGNILIMITMLGTVIAGWTTLREKLEVQRATMARIEAGQQALNAKMDDWYERLILLEERDRARRGAPRR